MIVVDASAIVAIGLNEEGCEAFALAISNADKAVASPVNLFEAGVVVSSRLGLAGPDGFLDWLAALGIQVVEEVVWEDALQAFWRFGKGRHPARLNLGDCFAYALANQLDAPLLFKGDDFSRTDIRPALQPT